MASDARQRRARNPMTRFTANIVRHEPSPQEIKAAKESRNFGFLEKLLGLDELKYAYLWKAVLIELFGTTFFVAASIGATLSSFGRQPSPDVPPVINPVALGVGIANAIIMAVLILSLAASSGGHMNPMISFATVLTGHTPLARGVLYIGAQTLGSVFGALIMRDSVPESTQKWSENSFGQGKLGGCAMAGLSKNEHFLIEFAFSMVVIIVAYGCAFDARQAKVFGPVLAPILIAITIGICIYGSGTLLSSEYSGAGMNPARCFGPAAVIGGDALDGHYVYWFAPFTAGAVNAIVYHLAPPHHREMYYEEQARLLRDRQKEHEENLRAEMKVSTSRRGSMGTVATTTELKSIPTTTELKIVGGNSAMKQRATRTDKAVHIDA